MQFINASSPNSNKFRSSHTILITTKNLNKLENQHLFSHPQEKWGRRADHCPAVKETNRWTQRIMQGPTGGKLQKHQCCEGKPELGLMGCRRLSVNHSAKSKISGGLNHKHGGGDNGCGFPLLDLYQFLTVNVGEESRPAHCKRTGKGTLLKRSRAFCSCERGLP